LHRLAVILNLSIAQEVDNDPRVAVGVPAVEESVERESTAESDPEKGKPSEVISAA